jgi:aldehyde:ferredoxin oxidoreductase
VAFAESLVKKISLRQGIGDDLAEGFPRAAKKWGRLEEDLKSGILFFPYWGYPDHCYDPRGEVYWGYSSILSSRDCNEHSLNALFWYPTLKLNPMLNAAFGLDEGPREPVPAEQLAAVYASQLIPFQDDPLMFDFSEENIYSEHMAKLVCWHRYYDSFWKNSALFCDIRYPCNIIDALEEIGNAMREEPLFFNAVTGEDLSFADGMKKGPMV